MLKNKLKLLSYVLGISAFLGFSALHATEERMYIDSNELDMSHDTFHIHLGHNVWIETSAMHRDETGLYTFEGNILNSRNSPKVEQQKMWKCPYCYHYWPIGTACQNSSCPSKYK